MLIVFLIILVISKQVTQQVYVAEDWVQSANNKFPSCMASTNSFM